jgi:hypothetical protein
MYLCVPIVLLSPTCPKQFDHPPTTIYYSAEFDPLLALLSPEIAPKNTYVEETRIT